MLNQTRERLASNERCLSALKSVLRWHYVSSESLSTGKSASAQAQPTFLTWSSCLQCRRSNNSSEDMSQERQRGGFLQSRRQHRANDAITKCRVLRKLHWLLLRNIFLARERGQSETRKKMEASLARRSGSARLVVPTFSRSSSAPPMIPRYLRSKVWGWFTAGNCQNM